MTFLMMVRHAERDLLDLAVTWSIATARWVVLLSCIGATVWSTPAAPAPRGESSPPPAPRK